MAFRCGLAPGGDLDIKTQRDFRDPGAQRAINLYMDEYFVLVAVIEPGC